MQLIVTVEQASTIDQLAATAYDLPEHTVTGPVCGTCTDTHRPYDGPRTQLRHASVEHIRFEATRLQEWAAESAAELAAERAAERYFENRGYDEARAQEDYEARFRLF